VPFENPPVDEIRALLTRVRTVAIVGLSPDPDRPSWGVAMYLRDRGYRIVPVRPGVDEVLGQPAYPTLAEVPFPVDLVNLFRHPRFVSRHVEETLRIGAGALWLQEGVIDEEAAERARAAGLVVVMDRCMLKEHRRAGLNKGRVRQA
jgi:predicted CoA-binding protein